MHATTLAACPPAHPPAYKAIKHTLLHCTHTQTHCQCPSHPSASRQLQLWQQHISSVAAAVWVQFCAHALCTCVQRDATLRQRTAVQQRFTGAGILHCYNAQLLLLQRNRSAAKLQQCACVRCQRARGEASERYRCGSSAELHHHSYVPLVPGSNSCSSLVYMHEMVCVHTLAFVQRKTGSVQQQVLYGLLLSMYDA